MSKIPMPRIVPCEWAECGCPGWHVVPNGCFDGVAVALPQWFTNIGSRMVRMPDTPASWPPGPNMRVRNRLGKLTEAIGDWVIDVSLNASWVKFIPQRYRINAHCNGGGELTQALVDFMHPEYTE